MHDEDEKEESVGVVTFQVRVDLLRWTERSPQPICSLVLRQPDPHDLQQSKVTVWASQNVDVDEARAFIVDNLRQLADSLEFGERVPSAGSTELTFQAPGSRAQN